MVRVGLRPASDTRYPKGGQPKSSAPKPKGQNSASARGEPTRSLPPIITLRVTEGRGANRNAQAA